MPTLIEGQSFCLSDPSINKHRIESYQDRQTTQNCKIYWINVYLHRVIGTQNGWNGYTSSIDNDIIHNLNSSYNQDGLYFKLIGSRDWFTDKYTDPYADPGILEISLVGIFEDPQSLQHSDAIDIYLLPKNIPIEGGGFVPGNNKKVMFVGGVRTVNHCTGGTTSYEIATSQVVSHEMGHCLGLPHTFDTSVGTSIDYVENRECIDPSTCRFVTNCATCNVSSNPTIEMNNFMAYTVPNCMSVFSDEQVSVMKENLDNPMSSVVARTQGAPYQITGDLMGPSEVSVGSLVWFNLLDQANESETFVWEFPTGIFPAGREDSNSVQTWVGINAKSGNIRIWKTNMCGDSNEKLKYVQVNPNDCLTCQTVKVFPNPALDEIHIFHLSQESGDQELLERQKRYILVDMTGKIVFEYKSLRRNLIMPLIGIIDGVYLLIIKDGNITAYQQKITVVR